MLRGCGVAVGQLGQGDVEEPRGRAGPEADAEQVHAARKRHDLRASHRADDERPGLPGEVHDQVALAVGEPAAPPRRCAGGLLGESWENVARHVVVQGHAANLAAARRPRVGPEAPEYHLC